MEPVKPKMTTTRERVVGLENKVGGDMFTDETHHPDPKKIDLADDVVIKRTTVNKITKQNTTETVRVTVGEFLADGDVDARFKELTTLQKKYAPKLPISSDVKAYVERLKTPPSRGEYLIGSNKKSEESRSSALYPKLQPDPAIRAGGFREFPSTVYGTRELVPPDMQRALENTTIGIELEAIGKQLDKIAEGVKSKKALRASEIKEGKPLTGYMDLLSGLDFIMIEGSLSQHLETLTNPDRGKPTEAEKGFIHKVNRLQTQLAQVQANAEKYAARAGIE